MHTEPDVSGGYILKFDRSAPDNSDILQTPGMPLEPVLLFLLLFNSSFIIPIF